MTDMATPSSSATEDRSRRLSRRGAFYNGIGLSLIVGLLIIVGLGVLGVSSLGWFTLSTAMAMIGLSIGLLSVVAVISLMSMRRTIDMLSSHEKALAKQADRHAALAAKVQDDRAAAQAERDRKQDEMIATHRTVQKVRDRDQDTATASLSDRQDAGFVEAEQRAEAARTAGNTRTATADPFAMEGAEVHPVQEVEGIGERYGALLEEIGITDTRDLWYADPVSVAGSIEADLLRVKDWQCMAELMAVEGIGPQYAELLVRSDIGSIPELSDQDPEVLQARIERLEGRLDKRVQGNEIGTKAVTSWIESARAHHNGGPATTTPETGGS